MLAGLTAFLFSAVLCFLLALAAQAENLFVEVVLMLVLPIALVPLVHDDDPQTDAAPCEEM
jgi:hypothetical protein